MQALSDLDGIRNKLLDEKQKWESTRAQAQRDARKDRPVSMLP